MDPKVLLTNSAGIALPLRALENVSGGLYYVNRAAQQLMQSTATHNVPKDGTVVFVLPKRRAK